MAEQPKTGEIAALKTLYPKLSVAEEGGFVFYLIEDLVLPDGANPQSVVGLLCPQERDGYPSRLFLSQKVTHRGPGQNWNPKDSVVILGRPWWAISWKTKQQNQTLIQMLLDHLGTFRS